MFGCYIYLKKDNYYSVNCSLLEECCLDTWPLLLNNWLSLQESCLLMFWWFDVFNHDDSFKKWPKVKEGNWFIFSSCGLTLKLFFWYDLFGKFSSCHKVMKWDESHHVHIQSLQVLFSSLRYHLKALVFTTFLEACSLSEVLFYCFQHTHIYIYIYLYICVYTKCKHLHVVIRKSFPQIPQSKIILSVWKVMEVSEKGKDHLKWSKTTDTA